MPSSTRLVGFLCALAAPLCWSIGGLVFRSVEAEPYEAIAWRSLGHLLVFPLFLMLRSGLRGWLTLAVAFARLAIVIGDAISRGTIVLTALAINIALGFRLGARQAAQPA
jgi:hypothetical protein